MLKSNDKVTINWTFGYAIAENMATNKKRYIALTPTKDGKDFELDDRSYGTAREASLRHADLLKEQKKQQMAALKKAQKEGDK